MALSPYQTSVADYWNAEANPVNLRLGEVDNIFHHHYGIGPVDHAALAGPEETREERLIHELHRLEGDQAQYLLDHLGDIRPEDRVLDSGCGRGGSSILANARFGCHVDGISISQKQVDFANAQAAQRGVDGKVRFHLRNMLRSGFPDHHFKAIWNNESTMYVDLSLLFAEYARMLQIGGRYVCITGCYNDVYGLPSRAVSQINAHYICDIHPRSTYFAQMAANRLVPTTVVDLTEATIPYWELRATSGVATGIEEVFLEAYKGGSFQYLMIVADRV